MKKPLLVAVAAIAAVLSGSVLYADDYPSRPVTFTAVFGPGSASDTICRIIADPLGAGAQATGHRRGSPRRGRRAWPRFTSTISRPTATIC